DPLDELRAVGEEGRDALPPPLGVRSGALRRPMALGPRGRYMPGIAAPIEDVALRDPQVLDELPGRMLDAWRALSRALGRKAGHALLEGEVGRAAAQEFEHPRAEIRLVDRGLAAVRRLRQIERRRLPGRRPGAEQLPEQHELSRVVGGVIGD